MSPSIWKFLNPNHGPNTNPNPNIEPNSDYKMHIVELGLVLGQWLGFKNFQIFELCYILLNPSGRHYRI